MRNLLRILCIVAFVILRVAVIHAEPSAKPTYQNQEKIEVNTLGSWDKAVIIAVGSGEHEGEFKVHYDGYASSFDRWLSPVYFRKVSATTATPAAPTQKDLAAKYQLNERIEVNTLGSWDKAAIIAVGSGEHEYEFKVHYDGYASSYDRWLSPVYFRKMAGAAAVPTIAATAPAATAPAPVADAPKPKPAAAAASAEPRLGKYKIFSYGAVGNAPLFLGHIELQAGGKYRISRKSSGDYYGEGTYAFDAATSAVQWLSGPCKDDNWSGTFTVEREGKTHKIRLRGTTIATNTSE